MKPKKLNLDTNKTEMPEGDYVGARNITSVQNADYKINEHGVRIFEKPGTLNNNRYSQPHIVDDEPYRLEPIGEKVIDDGRVIIFSIGYFGNSTQIAFSEIGIIDKEGVYTTVINDFFRNIYTLDNTLKFNPYFPIVAEYNYVKNDLIVGFTDFNEKPKVINIDYYLRKPPSPTDKFNINNILMFPDFKIPRTKVTTNLGNDYGGITVNNSGGTNLESGSHHLCFAYEDVDGAITDVTPPLPAIYIFKDAIEIAISNDGAEGSLPDVLTSKSVTVELIDVDTRFKYLIVYSLQKVQGGQVVAKKCNRVNITASTLSFVYGGGTWEDVDLNQILIGRRYISKMKHLTQINNALYSVDTEGRRRIKYQKYANLIDIHIESKFVDIRSTADPVIPPKDAKASAYSFNNVGLQHREVYAVYFHWVLTDGSLSEGFHIPAFRKLTSAQIDGKGWRADSTVVNELVAKKFQVEDTCALVGERIETGFWENEDEKYPITENHDFDSTTDYNGNTLTGGKNLEGQKVRHPRMPSIAWMRANVYNSGNSPATYGKTGLDMLGISLTNVILPSELAPYVDGWTVSFAERQYGNSLVLGQSQLIASAYSPILNKRISNGINKAIKRFIPYALEHNLVGGGVRFYDFAMMKNMPAFSTSSYLALELQFDSNSWYVRSNQSNISPPQYNRITGYVNVGEDATITANGTRFKINSYNYLPTNATTGEVDNRFLENTLELAVNGAFDWGSEYITNDEYVGKHGGVDGTKQILATLVNHTTNVYNSVFKQKLRLTGLYVKKNVLQGTFYRGDVYIVHNSINAMGHSADNDPSLHGEYGGFRWAYVWICESIYNSELRNSYSNYARTQYFFKYGVIQAFNNRLADINGKDCALPYDFNTDYVSSNSYKLIPPFDPDRLDRETLDKDRFKISRSLPQVADVNINMWKTWLVNDYKNFYKDKGDITNVQGFDRNLLIHTATALFMTRSNEELKVDLASVFIGQGNIFERDPEEIIPSEEGTFGTQHRFSCKLTEVGYVFIDSEKGRLCLFDGGKNVIVLSDVMMRAFLQSNLRITPPSKIADTILMGIKPTDDNPYFFNGFNVVYDSLYKRLIISKKHFVLSPTVPLILKNGKYTIGEFLIGYDNISFENKSFTLSYSLIDNGFTCFHDYIPDRLINTRTEVLAFVKYISTNNKTTICRLFRHNFEGNKGIYYNTSIINIDTLTEAATPFSSYVVMCFAPTKGVQGRPSIEFINASWIADIITKTGAKLSWETFNYILAFNSYQSTDEFLLKPFNFTNYFESNTRNIKNTWYFDKLIDLLRDDIFITGIPFQPFIVNDKLNLDISPIDLDKHFFNKLSLIDKFLCVKLLYSNELNGILQNEIRILDISVDGIISPR